MAKNNRVKTKERVLLTLDIELIELLKKVDNKSNFVNSLIKREFSKK